MIGLKIFNENSGLSNYLEEFDKSVLNGVEGYAEKGNYILKIISNNFYQLGSKGQFYVKNIENRTDKFEIFDTNKVFICNAVLNEDKIFFALTKENSKILCEKMNIKQATNNAIALNFFNNSDKEIFEKMYKEKNKYLLKANNDMLDKYL